MALYEATWLAYEAKNNQTLSDHQPIMGTSGWRVARPINYMCDTWLQRLRQAWGVLFGRYDAIDWSR